MAKDEPREPAPRPERVPLRESPEYPRQPRPQEPQPQEPPHRFPPAENDPPIRKGGGSDDKPRR